MRHFQAELIMATQGIESTEFYDHGIVQTWTGQTVEEVLAKVARSLRVEDFELFEGRLEASNEAVDEDGNKYIEMYSLYLSEINTKQIPFKTNFVKAVSHV